MGASPRVNWRHRSGPAPGVRPLLLAPLVAGFGPADLADDRADCGPGPAGMTRTAIVHDWLTGMRGGEKVLESVCRLLPDADLFTLFYDPRSVSETIRGRRITTSWLNRVPGIHRHYRNYLPLFPRAVESFDLR